MIITKPWYEIANMVESYIVFKGIEEDVVWIGKSDNLEFKNFRNADLIGYRH